MAIVFDDLPSSNPNGSAGIKGTFYGVVENPAMRTPKDAATSGKPDYLSFQLILQNQKGQEVGRIYDMLNDSDSGITKYKIKRFITALHIPITGSFELKDLVKIINKKKLIVDITLDKDDKSVVDVFKNEIYYPLEAAAEVFGTSSFDAPTESTGVVNATDSEDQLPFGEEPAEPTGDSY